MRFTPAPLLAVLLACPCAAAQPTEVSLFDGATLAGWEGNPDVWRVRDGVIVGGSLDGNPRNEFLATTGRYRDFALRLDYRLVGSEGFVNGGVQIRSVRISDPPNEMLGYQADIGAGHSGKLYDESRRRRFLAEPPPGLVASLEKPGEWNRYEILAEGPRVRLRLNGTQVLEYVESEPGIGRDGHIALQIHGGCKAEIAFRELTITEFGEEPVAAVPPRPNIVLINIDDLGYADIGPFGGTNRTPHLDRMAREGLRLTSHYAAPVCTPSRAALLTGCYPKRVLPIPHVLFPAAAVGLHPDERTLAEALKEAGYATACFGKWHLGDQPEFLPTRQGFDEFYGIPYSNDMGPAADGAKSSLGAPIPTEAEMAERARRARNQGADEAGIRIVQPPLPLLENETVVGRVRAAEQAAITGRLVDRAVDFIRERREGPFFLYLPHVAVHFPLYPASGFAGRSPNGLLGDWVEELDAGVGRILDTLRELELEGNTLVVFTSDNGGHTGFGSNNAPLRGSKAQVYEGGIRVPTLVWWPGRIPAGRSVDAITTMMDFLPTFAGLAGVPAAVDDRPIDGVDLLPLLTGRPGAVTRDVFLYHRGLDLHAVRAGFWKLHLAGGELYDLAADIGETTDLAAARPDVVARLMALAQSTAPDLGTSGIGPGCRPLGRVDAPVPLIPADGTL